VTSEGVPGVLFSKRARRSPCAAGAAPACQYPFRARRISLRDHSPAADRRGAPRRAVRRREAVRLSGEVLQPLHRGQGQHHPLPPFQATGTGHRVAGVLRDPQTHRASDARGQVQGAGQGSCSSAALGPASAGA
jgi:hypothetical protein